VTAHVYNNVEDIFSVVRRLRDRLSENGEKEAAEAINETLTTFWTTASEALGEIKDTLLQVRPTVEKVLGLESTGLLDEVVSGATKLWNE
jgi:signal transduction histidine kinase